jgi:thiol-disulfide isomerase/thioredoxin
MKINNWLVIFGLLFFLTGLALALGGNGKVVGQAADFTLKDLQDKSHTLFQCRGKVVLLNFWATWCPPCRSEMPALQKLYEQADKTRFAMVTVNMGENREDVAKFMKNNGYTFPVLIDKDGVVARQYNVNGIPTTLVINETGGVMRRVVGAKEWTWAELKLLTKAK